MGKGGVSKSLASLLHYIDYSKYNVDLFLFAQKGLYLTDIPNEVNLLPANETGIELLKKGYIWSLLKRKLSYRLLPRISSLEIQWSLFWKLNKFAFRTNNKEYDVAISYNDGVELFYLIDFIKAQKKIGYNHTSYTNKLTYKPSLDLKYYNKLDYIVTVSEQCAIELKKVFPSEASKVKVIENIVDKDSLFYLAGKKDPFYELVEDRENTTVIVTVAGLYVRKGFDFSSAALGKLKKEGYCFKWFIVGVGPDEKEVKRFIYDNGISNETVFLYEQNNPYKYVKWADVFMLTSHAEGKSIAVEEAKLLEKPILITHYSSAYDQINHNETGIIAEMNNESVCDELRRLLNDKDLRRNLSQNLKDRCHSNIEENLSKIYALWN